MKYILLYSILAFSMLACNDNPAGHLPEGSKSSQHDHEEASGVIELNNGARWKSDVNTNKNISAFQTILHDFKLIPVPRVKDCTDTGKRLQKQMDILIGECRMKGPDHEALHKWLTPLIADISSLVKATDASEGAHMVEAIERHVKSYPNYFE
jgi:hypothetical protein